MNDKTVIEIDTLQVILQWIKLTLKRTHLGILTPLRKHFICGIPLPIATGYTCRKAVQNNNMTLVLPSFTVHTFTFWK